MIILVIVVTIILIAKTIKLMIIVTKIVTRIE